MHIAHTAMAFNSITTFYANQPPPWTFISQPYVILYIYSVLQIPTSTPDLKLHITQNHTILIIIIINNKNNQRETKLKENNVNGMIVYHVLCNESTRTYILNSFYTICKRKFTISEPIRVNFFISKSRYQ